MTSLFLADVYILMGVSTVCEHEVSVLSCIVLCKSYMYGCGALLVSAMYCQPVSLVVSFPLLYLTLMNLYMVLDASL